MALQREPNVYPEHGQRSTTPSRVVSEPVVLKRAISGGRGRSGRVKLIRF